MVFPKHQTKYHKTEVYEKPNILPDWPNHSNEVIRKIHPYKAQIVTVVILEGRKLIYCIVPIIFISERLSIFTPKGTLHILISLNHFLSFSITVSSVP